MKIASEIVGLFVISLVMMAIPILCSLSFAYNWFGRVKLILLLACFVEWIGLITLLSNITGDYN